MEMKTDSVPNEDWHLQCLSGGPIGNAHVMPQGTLQGINQALTRAQYGNILGILPWK